MRSRGRRSLQDRRRADSTFVPRAAAVPRDLRLFARGRGRASALRAGRARRPALVGPPAGFPHRGARPGQGAAGEERRHRAGRRQGRLRAEAAAGGRRATRSSRPAGRPTTASSPACLDSPTIIEGGADRAAEGRRPARRRRSLSRGRRRQGHGDVLRHRQRELPLEHGFWLGDAFASGGSAGYDHKKMGITARGAWEAVKRHFREMNVDIQTHALHRRRRRRHVGRRVRQRHAAVAEHQAGRRLRPSRHLHRSRPRSGRALRRAPAPVRLPRSSWQDYDKALISQGRRRVLARREADRAVAGDAGAAEARQGERARRPRSSARSSRRRSTCSGSAASAPMCGPERDQRRRRRPRQRRDPRHRARDRAPR